MNDNLHPIFQQALRGLFPPPASVFPERLPMRAFMVRVIDRKSGTVRESFEAMASDSVTCVQQHMSHALEGEKLDVMSLEAFREQQAKPKAHLMRRESTGTGLGDKTTPVCACGWRGRPVPQYSNVMFTDLQDQERAHMAGEK
jgi:hypothetical protein